MMKVMKIRQNEKHSGASDLWKTLLRLAIHSFGVAKTSLASPRCLRTSSSARVLYIGTTCPIVWALHMGKRPYK